MAARDRWAWKPVVEGHWWTVASAVAARLRPVPIPQSSSWSTWVDDPRLGPVRLHGRLHEGGASTLLLVVHGLGGEPDSPYCRRITPLAEQRGWACLRLALRGSSGDGEDLYHAGLGSDLTHALADPTLQRYDRVLVLGFSLGGHLALRMGLAPDPRVVGIAAISSPLDLALGCRAIDRRSAWLYRRHVLSGLKRGYRRTAARRALASAVDEVVRVRTLREWDRLAVVPRFGFGDVEAYHRSQSVGPRLGELKVPGLYVGMRHDPMVPRWTVEPSLSTDLRSLDVRWLDGGHVAAPGSWEGEVLAWLDRQRPYR
ncbi:alpha/beta fold hydrolase [Paraliomyxa miuraensis]|uniref:alpha/beta fold hydrolase n=1 Tax=Paraliomyxa miuraensis TaxID=376150 RepID=UPI002259E76A|nr:alpha/beta fold hydrolase [Paraliomyxa miuraensis]MCX4239867.1 alpha/beta fold hydrolase [Paraliomyxa miuraensis]